MRKRLLWVGPVYESAVEKLVEASYEVVVLNNDDGDPGAFAAMYLREVIESYGLALTDGWQAVGLMRTAVEMASHLRRPAGSPRYWLSVTPDATPTELDRMAWPVKHAVGGPDMRQTGRAMREALDKPLLTGSRRAVKPLDDEIDQRATQQQYAELSPDAVRLLRADVRALMAEQLEALEPLLRIIRQMNTPTSSGDA